MPRYYFNFVHGKRTYKDENGKEYSDITSVNTEASAAARRLMKRSSPRSRPNWSNWIVLVLDAKGEEVMRTAFPQASIDADDAMVLIATK
jgi:hypothetical protein